VNILHLLGDTADLGGILSVVRCLQEVTTPLGDRHVVWVHPRYRETRRPALTYHQGRFLLAESPRHLGLLGRALPAFLEVRGYLRRNPCQMVHAHTRGAFPVAVLLGGLTRQPVLFTNHTYANRTGLYRQATRIPRLHSVLLTPNMARHYGVDPAAANVSIISECCRDRFFEGPLPESRGGATGSEPLRLVGVGNIVRWKKWHLLLEALARLEPRERAAIDFRHWGEAPADADSQAYLGELEALVRRHELAECARFEGPTLDIPERLAEADCFVLPSTNEPCSVALIEALALGLPALVSASGGNVDIVIQGKTGLTFAPDDPVDLANQLRKLLAGPGFSAPAEIRRSVAARRASQVAREYRELYVRLASAEPQGTPSP
jgi:glycosyltransferase involved in cell wall biosynthesis